jgi:histidinol-phosphate aminotransferase
MLIKVGEGRTVFEELQQRQIIVRPMNGYGLPEYVRVTIAGSAENTRLIEELEALKEEGIIQS